VLLRQPLPDMKAVQSTELSLITFEKALAGFQVTRSPLPFLTDSKKCLSKKS
jgi:hypothetical protein